MERLIENLKIHKSNIENFFQSKFIYFYGEINQENFDTYSSLRDKLITTDTKEKLCIIMITDGGDIEMANQMMINTNRPFDVIYIVPWRAISAGTLFALSTYRLLMNSSISELGALDVQYVHEKTNKQLSHKECIDFIIDCSEKEDLIQFIQDYKILASSLDPPAEIDYSSLLNKVETFPIERIKVEAFKKMCEEQNRLNRIIESSLEYRWKDKINPNDFNWEDNGVSTKKISQLFSDYIFLNQEGLDIHKHCDGISMQKLQTFFGLQIENYETLEIANDINSFYDLVLNNLDYLKKNQQIAVDDLHIIIGSEVVVE